MKTLVIYDCSSIHDMIEEVRKTNKKAKFDYRNAQTFFSNFAQTIGWEQPDENSSIAFVTTDQGSERQHLFIKALTGSGILVESVDYRLAMPTLPIGIKFSNVGNLVDLSPYISYVLGLKSNEQTNVIIISRTFGSYGPLTDFIVRRGGHAYLAFFKRFLDVRWLKEVNSDGYKPDKINLLNLEDSSETIIGVELATPEPARGFSSI